MLNRTKVNPIFILLVLSLAAFTTACGGGGGGGSTDSGGGNYSEPNETSTTTPTTTATEAQAYIEYGYSQVIKGFVQQFAQNVQKDLSSGAQAARATRVFNGEVTSVDVTLDEEGNANYDACSLFLNEEAGDYQYSIDTYNTEDNSHITVFPGGEIYGNLIRQNTNGEWRISIRKNEDQTCAMVEHNNPLEPMNTEVTEDTPAVTTEAQAYIEYGYSQVIKGFVQQFAQNVQKDLSSGAQAARATRVFNGEVTSVDVTLDEEGNANYDACSLFLNEEAGDYQYSIDTYNTEDNSHITVFPGGEIYGNLIRQNTNGEWRISIRKNEDQTCAMVEHNNPLEPMEKISE